MSETGLSDFQIELAAVFFSLPQSSGFLLAGGGALIAHGIVHRPTQDLDFFTSRQRGDIDAVSTALTSAATSRAWRVEVIQESPEFRRLAITGPPTVLVDIAVDSPPTDEPTVTIAGPALAPHELAVRKTLALFDRAEPRDFVDVYVLNQQFGRDDTLRAALRADPGFNLAAFTDALRSHRRLDDTDFPDIGISPTHIRDYFDAWAAELEGR